MFTVTVCIRLAIFPLVIMAQRNAAQMHNHMPTITRLQEKMTRARASGDVTEGKLIVLSTRTVNEMIHIIKLQHLICRKKRKRSKDYLD